MHVTLRSKSEKGVAIQCRVSGGVMGQNHNLGMGGSSRGGKGMFSPGGTGIL